MTDTEKYTRRVESERIFARANAVLAEHGLMSAAQNAAQGKLHEVISRHAKRLGAEVILEPGPSAVLLIAESLEEVMQHAQTGSESAAGSGTSR
jgi:hypothetical protein